MTAGESAALGAVFGRGQLRETEPTEWPGRYVGRVEIAGYPYDLVAEHRVDAQGRYLHVFVHNVPKVAT